jgi:short-subunit dehydrogenase
MMNNYFSEKNIWLTGASSGIGRALAEALIQTGCRIIVTSRNEKELYRLKHNSPDPEKVIVLPHDIADYPAAGEKVKTAIEALGKIDIMIHNAGISQRALAIDTDIEVDKKLMETNYLGTVALTKALLPHFVGQRAGHFAVVTSLTGIIGSPLRSGYAASKHALHGFFDSLRAEHAKDNIKVTLICPGYVVTNISINALTGDGTPQRRMDTATSRGITARQAAQKILRAISRQQSEVYIGKKEVLAVYLKRYVPLLFEKILERAKVV